MLENKFIKKFKIGSEEYLLNKTEIRINKRKGNEETVIKLNDLDPHVEYIKYISTYSLFLIVLYSIGFIAGISFLIFNHFQFHAENVLRMIWVVGLIIFLGFMLKKRYVNAWHFNYRFQPGVGLKINYNKRDSQTIKQLLEALSTAIKQAETPIHHIVFLLGHYHLLSPNEYNELLAKMYEQKPAESATNVIDIKGHIK